MTRALDKFATPRAVAAAIITLGIVVALTIAVLTYALIEVRATEQRVSLIERPDSRSASAQLDNAIERLTPTQAGRIVRKATQSR